MAQLIMGEGATPSTPGSGKGSIFINLNGILCWVDDAGNVYAVAPSNQAVTFTGTLTLNKVLMGAGADLTIASGVITVTHSLHRVDTEGAAATDDLVTINGAGIRQRLILETVSSTRDVVVKHGTGNIFLNGAADFTLSHVRDKLVLLSNAAGTEWHQLSASDNSA